MMDSQCLPVKTLDVGMFYYSPLTLYLLCQDAAADRQRLLRLQSELSRHCGSLVEFHARVGIVESFAIEPDAMQKYADSGGKVTWDYWEVSTSPWNHEITEVELHSRPLRAAPGALDVSAEGFLEHLLQAGTIDWALIRSDPQIDWPELPLSSKKKMAHRPYLYISIGSRAAHYVSYMNFVWTWFTGKYFCKITAAVLGLTPMSNWEAYKFVSANIDNNIKVLYSRDIRALVKAVNKELRAKLSRKEFIRLMASFA